VSYTGIDKEKLRQQLHTYLAAVPEAVNEENMWKAGAALLAAVGTLILLNVGHQHLTNDANRNLSDNIADFPEYNLSEREQVLEIPVYDSSDYASMKERCRKLNGTVTTNKSSLDGVETVSCVLS
jgi:hypothetical protein